ncbi:MAG: DUF177 domain-containing protein [Thermodesulfovibrionales bacterium]
MKIVIPDIPEEGIEVDFRENVGIDRENPASPVSGRLLVTKTDREIGVTGNLQAEIGFSCSRCLKPFRRSLDLPVDVVYHPLEEEGREQHELHDDEMDMGFYQGDEIDLQDLVREQVLLNLQMKPLCDEQCRGICPKCGADLNEGPCGCPQKEADPRFSVLKKLLPEGKE